MDTSSGGPSAAKSWLPEEDSKILALVSKHGIRKWSIVSAELPGRNGKQCRERWHNQLDPNIKRGPWTLEEDQLLLRAHSEHGSKWSLIAKCLPGRTDNSIKNRWNSALRRELRKMNRAAEDAELGRTPVDEPELVAPALAAPGLASAAPGGEGAGSAPGGLLPLPFAAAPLAVDGPTGACQPLAGDAAPTPTTPTAQPLPTAPLAPHGADAPLIGAAHDNASTAQRALRSELAALRESSSDDATKRLLRAQLVEQLRQLNATWENTGVAPSANHIQELGKQVSRLQDFCRDLVGSSLTRQQLEIASGNVPKRRQCMARGRRRIVTAAPLRRGYNRPSTGTGADAEERAEQARKRARHAADVPGSGGAHALASAMPDAREHDGRMPGTEAFVNERCVVEGTDMGEDEEGDWSMSGEEGDESDDDGDDADAQQPAAPCPASWMAPPPDSRPPAGHTGPAAAAHAGHAGEGASHAAGGQPHGAHDGEVPTLHGDADLRIGPSSLFGLGPVLTPNGTNLFSFDVDELLAITGATLADVLASPRGMPLVTLSPAGGFVCNFPTPRDGRDSGSALGMGAAGMLALPTPHADSGAQPTPAGAGSAVGSLGWLSALPSPATVAAAIAQCNTERSARAHDMHAPRAPPLAHARSSLGGAVPGTAGVPASRVTHQHQPPLLTIGSHSTPLVLLPSPLVSGSPSGGTAGSPFASSGSDQGAPPLGRRVSTLSERRRPRGATNLHIAHAAGERPAAASLAVPPSLHAMASTFSNEATTPSASGAGALWPMVASDDARPAAAQQADPLAKAIASDVSQWLDAR